MVRCIYLQKWDKKKKRARVNEYAVPFNLHIDKSHQAKSSVYWSEIIVIRTHRKHRFNILPAGKSQ
jgi:hypothetical protein